MPVELADVVPVWAAEPVPAGSERIDVSVEVSVVADGTGRELFRKPVS